MLILTADFARVRYPMRLVLCVAAAGLVSCADGGYCEQVQSVSLSGGSACEDMITPYYCCSDECENCPEGHTCSDGFCQWHAKDELTEEPDTEESDGTLEIVTIAAVLMAVGISVCLCVILIIICRGSDSSKSAGRSAVMALQPMAPAPMTMPPVTYTGYAGGPTSPGHMATAPSLSAIRAVEEDKPVTLMVQCGACHRVVHISMKDSGVGRFTCPACLSVNEFSVGFCRNDPQIEVKFPAYWKTQSMDGRLIEQETEVVKKAVQKLLDKTWEDKLTRDRGDHSGGVPKYEVIMVQRNENPKVWAPYYRLREQLRRDLNKKEGVQYWEVETQKALADSPDLSFLINRGKLVEDANEFYLFHGTRPSAAKAICDDDFQVKLAGVNAGSLYGPGIYFAEASSKADEYAQDDQDGIFKDLFGLLICRVTAGNVHYNCDRNPPVQDLVDSVLQHKTHHSIMGDRKKCRGTYREFIVFDKNQAYPEYIVIYRRVSAAVSE